MSPTVRPRAASHGSAGRGWTRPVHLAGPHIAVAATTWRVTASSRPIVSSATASAVATGGPEHGDPLGGGAGQIDVGGIAARRADREERRSSTGPAQRSASQMRTVAPSRGRASAQGHVVVDRRAGVDPRVDHHVPSARSVSRPGPRSGAVEKMIGRSLTRSGAPPRPRPWPSPRHPGCGARPARGPGACACARRACRSTSPVRKVASPVNAGLRYCAVELVMKPTRRPMPRRSRGSRRPSTLRSRSRAACRRAGQRAGGARATGRSTHHR